VCKHSMHTVCLGCPVAAGCSGGFINMWSSCFQAGSITESAHSLGSTGSLPGPGTPMQSGHLLLSAHSSKSLPQLPPEPPASDDTGSGCESGSGDDSSGLGLDAVMADSPRAAHSSALYGAEHGEPDCQLIGHNWKLWAHKHVLKSECVRSAASASAAPCIQVLQCRFNILFSAVHHGSAPVSTLLLVH
jgi:hypothetical protein